MIEASEATRLVRTLVTTSSDAFVQAERLRGPSDRWTSAHRAAIANILEVMLGRKPTEDEITEADIG